MIQPPKSHFLKEIEGLRGILALWVFASHLMWGSGFTPDLVKGIWCIPFAGGSAVTVFICISGFVIFLLLGTKSDSYLSYITRRFFRIYPVFIATTLVAAILFLTHAGTLGGDYSGPNVFVRSPEYYSLKFKILTLHACMLHGFLSDLGPIALNPPSWSISLEWQFYLLAPLFFWFFKKNWSAASVVLLTIVVIKSRIHPEGILNQHGATLIDQLLPFTVGMMSWFFYSSCHNTGSASFYKKLLISLSIGMLFLSSDCIINIFMNRLSVPIPQSVPYMIWIIVFIAMVGRINAPDQSSSVSRLLNHQITQFLGKLSYSIYLTHQIVIFVFLLFFGRWILGMHPSKAFWIEFVILTPLTIALSILTHRYLEVPGIEAGKRIVAKLFPTHAS